MEETDYENWDDEREAIIDDTLETLRDQRDDKQELRFAGKHTFNPSVFSTLKTYTYGPILFDSNFSEPPHMSFSQIMATTVSQNEIPFLVVPFVSSFSFTNGEIDGFYLGLYALTPVTTLVAQHTISWEVTGVGSPYLGEQVEESWTDAYDQNDAEFLTEEVIDESDY